MDAVGKRQCVLAIFILIQANKLYDWLNWETHLRWGFVAKWALWETSLFLFLWHLRIPRLSFSLFVALLLAGFLLFINGAFFVILPWTIEALRLRYMPLSATVEMVGGIDGQGVDDIAGSKELLLQDIKNTSHLSGTYTVKIRPWSTGQLNPEQIPLCLPVTTPMPNSHGLSESLRRPILSSASVNIPLQLKGTGPWTATILRNGLFYRDFKGKSNNGDLLSTEITVDQLGTYEIAKIVDGNDTEGKVGLKPVTIDACPQARLDGLIVQHAIEMCNNCPFPVKVWLIGQAPFIISFEILSDTGTKQITVPDVYPSGENSEAFKLWIYNLPGVPKISQFLLRISAVQDAHGRIHQYGVWDNGDSVIVDVFPPPSISWIHEQPLKIRQDQSSIPLSVKISGMAPFHLSIEKPDGNLEELNNLNKSLALITATSPGTYRLVSIRDSLCKGAVDSRLELSVQLVYRPSLKVQVDTIKSPCRGDVGLSFILFPTGEGPWYIMVRQRHRRLKDSLPTEEKTFNLQLSTPRYMYEWRPDIPGLYDLELLALSDMNYKNVTLSGYKYVQDINPTPGAVLVPQGDFFLCLGDSLDIPISFSGVGPWLLEYSTAKPDGKTQNSHFEALTAQAVIQLDQFTKGGRYLISLLSVTDSAGCSSSLPASESRSITVYNRRPEASFLYSTAKIREGTEDLVPIKLNVNKAPAKIVLRHISESGQAQAFDFLVDCYSRGLSLMEPGDWSIESISDEFCTSKSSVPGSSVRVKILPRPVALFDSNISPWTCRSNDIHPVSVIVKGNEKVSLSFSVQYSPDEAGLKTARKERKVIAGYPPSLSLTSPNARLSPGFYQYELFSISDTAFPEQILSGPSFIQHVLPDPAPRIAPFLQHVNTFCPSLPNRTIGPFLIDFTGIEIQGTTPIKFKYELVAQNGTTLAVQDINTNTTVGDPLKLELASVPSPGPLHIRITQVENAFKCLWTSPKHHNLLAAAKEHYALAVSIVERPSIIRAPDQAESFCVGDVARFELKGTGPWTVQYALKGPHSNSVKSDTVNFDRLSILLAESGMLTINSVCNRHCCSDLPPEGLIFHVHSLPSAAITEGVRYLREGEETEFKVVLQGEPPFSFSYQRIDDKNGKAIETLHVKDVIGAEHRVKVASSGTFRVIAVQDRHCQYPKRR